MSVIGNIKSWFESAAASKADQSHQAEEGDKPVATTRGVGDASDKLEDAKETEQDWHGDT